MKLPEEYEFIGFFESEPIFSSYHEVQFFVKRGDDEVAVDIYAPSGKFKITWKNSDRQLISMKLTQLDFISIDSLSKDELLTVSGTFSDGSIILKLRLKPFVSVEFDQRFTY